MCSKLNKTGFKNKLVAVITIVMASSSTVCSAQLSSKSSLSIKQGVGGFEAPAAGTGSWFAMEAMGEGGWVYTGIDGVGAAGDADLLLTGTAQFAEAENVDTATNPSSVANIDNPWTFFGSTGQHGSTGITAVAGNQIDMSGWYVSWNNVPFINMGAGGLVTITCDDGNICGNGAGYTLDYATAVPSDSPSFPNVNYQLHLEGTIVDLNQAPTAKTNPLSSSVAPNGFVRIDAVGNTTDPDGDAIDRASVVVTYADALSRAATIFVCTAASTPDLLCQAEGDIIYTDNAGTDTSSPDTFTYTVTDSLGKIIATPVNVNMDVVTGNLPPACGNAAVTINVNTAINIDVASKATDSDGSVAPATVVLMNQSLASGTLGTLTDGVVTFTATTAGVASFDYTVEDDLGAVCTTPGTITININALPVAVGNYAAVDRNSSSGVVIDVTANDSDLEDGTVDATTVAIVTDVVNGVTSIDAITGKVTYIPETNYLGEDFFTYTVKDSEGATSNEAHVIIDVVNALPVTVNDAASIDTALVSEVDISVLDNDTDFDGTLYVTTVTVVTDAAHGTTYVKATGKVTYTPNAGYVGPDEFTYTVNDNNGGASNVATVAISVSNDSVSVLDPAAFLSIVPAPITADNLYITPADGTGSWFSMELTAGTHTHTPIKGFNQLQLGTSQPASAATPDIDSVWTFFGNPGVHQTTSVVTILTDNGNGNVTLDLSGWDVSWSNIASIPMDSKAHTEGFVDGVAIMTCAVDCSVGDSYILEYSATVPDGDPSKFGGVKYFLHLEGTIAQGATTVGGGNEAAGYNVTIASASDDGGLTVTMLPGATAESVGNTTGIHLSAVDIGLKDPKLNDADGAQCVGGCIDFYATGITPGGYMDMVVYLSEAIPEGADYRKLMNGVWKNFDESQGDLVGSALAVAGACQGTDGVFQIGLRAGNQCLFLRIYDGGPNDADGVANGTIVDPSGVLVAGSPNVPASSTDGCSVSSVPVKLTERADWLLVAAFIAGFGLLTYRRRERNIR